MITSIVRTHPRRRGRPTPGARRAGIVSAIVVLIALSAPLISTPTAAALPPGLNYVALGDSRAAGSLPAFEPANGCWQSSVSYPRVLARSIAPRSFVDRSCAGAWAANITHLPENGPFGPIPPQIRWVTRSTDLVTISIGGNDLNWGAIAGRCTTQVPGGDARCRTNGAHLAAADRSLNHMTAVMDSAVRAVRAAAAPHARIVIVGHGGVIGTRGCWPFVPASDADARWMNSFMTKVNAAQARIAQRYDAAFIDVMRRSVGHDPCAAQPWFEGTVPRSLAVSGHPNEIGMAKIAEWIRTQVR
ncbi:SGNH/GDSL hydrolase family protein [Gordonia sp. NPDC003950]